MYIHFADDIVYNQSMVGGNTIDKRRPDLRDELGYIAPPNRKLPPVPGSNYNTCDRIKRGTAISKRLQGLRLQLVLLCPPPIGLEARLSSFCSIYPFVHLDPFTSYFISRIKTFLCLQVKYSIILRFF